MAGLADLSGGEHRNARVNLAGRFLARPNADHYESELIERAPMGPFRTYVVLTEFVAASWVTQSWYRGRRIYLLTTLGEQMMTDMLEQTIHG